jgi:hypothetical protein
MHSFLSASGMERWSKCPGSVRLHRSTPPELIPPSSIYAVEGTIAHQICEGTKYNVPIVRHQGYDIKINDEMHNAVDIFTRYVNNIENDNSVIFSMSECQLGPSKLHSELFGTADKIILTKGGSLFVIDFKYGKNKPVAVEYNLQLQLYAFLTLEYVYERFRPIDIPVITQVSLVIIQPRYMAEPIRTWTVPVTRITHTFKSYLLDCVSKTELPDAELIEGSHCWFCPAKNLCPIKKQKQDEKLLTLFEPIKE